MKQLNFVIASLVPQFALQLSASPAKPVGVPTLVDQAQTIVVASLVGGRQAGQRFSCTLLVARVLKGSTAPGSLLAVSWRSGETAGESKSLPSVEGLWFLGDNGGSSLTALPLDLRGDFDDVFLPVSVAPLPVRYGYDTARSVLEKVLLEVGAALETPGQYGRSKLWEAFNGLPAGIGVNALSTVASSSSAEGQVAALSALIDNGDLAALQQVEANYDFLMQAPNTIQLYTVIAFRFRNTGPAAIQSLIRLSQRNGQLRTAAARSLAAIHNPETLTALAQLLDAPTPEMQVIAVNGFSSFVMSLPVAIPENFRNMGFLKPTGPSPLRTKDMDPFLCLEHSLPSGRENQVVQFWKTWWSQNSSAVLKP